MSRRQLEQKYKSMGLEVEYGKDKSGAIYEPHNHEKTYLYTLSGSINIRVDGGEWQELGPGNEFVIEAGQLHEAVVGKNGWEYVVAWNAEEAKRYE